MSNAELEEKMAQAEERYTETVQENDEHASLVQKSPVLKVGSPALVISRSLTSKLEADV